MKDFEKSLGGGDTYAGNARPATEAMSLGDQGTLGDAHDNQETIVDDIEIVDLDARYKIESTLGRGGMGEVLLAFDSRLERKVAIKRILGEAARSKTAVERFLTEAKSIAALNHPNVVQIYDYGRAKDGPFLIMEYVDGSSLLDRCRDGALPLEEAIDLTCQLCDGLAKAHDQGIVHRDIKPANVLLTTDGLPKLTDFGLAKAEASDHQMTMAGAVLGTPDFMSPEQRRDAAEVDARSDLWSLAATFYQMVTGRSPKIIRLNELPRHLQGTVGKALEDNKVDRFQTARDLRVALQTASRAATNTPQELTAGECPSCGVTNEGHRKFCKKCAGPLDVPCLACNENIPCWEEVCAQCGARQKPLLEERRQRISEIQSEASEYLSNSEFSRARESVEKLANERDPRLKDVPQWINDFSEALAAEEASQQKRASDFLFDALRHEEAFDYESALGVVGQIPDSLRSLLLPNHGESARDVGARLEQKASELQRLETLIDERLANNQFEDLLQLTHDFLLLSPHNARIQALAKQLAVRQEKLDAQRNDVLQKARHFYSTQQYIEASKVLSTLNHEAKNEEAKVLHSKVEKIQERLQEIRATIETAIKKKQFDGLLRRVDEYLELMANDSSMQHLKQKLIERENELDALCKKLCDEAKQSWKECRFENAASQLEKIPSSRQTEATKSWQESCFSLAAKRATVIDRLAVSQISPTRPHAIPLATEYLDIVRTENLNDPEVRKLYETAREHLVQEQQQRSRFWRVIALLGLASCIVLAWGTYTVIRVYTQQSDVAVGKAVAAPAAEPSGRLIDESAELNQMGTPELLANSSDTERVPPQPAINIDEEIPTFENSIGMMFTQVPSGSFIMGEETGRPDEVPHKVEIQEPFFIQKTEVTNLQWTLVTGALSTTSPDLDAPVTNISWYEAVEFCSTLSEKPEEVAAGFSYRLPTEEEWEYSCRADRPGKWGVAETAEVASRLIRHLGNSRGPSKTLKPGNAWEIYNMNGNVAEWCDASYVADLTSGEKVLSPQKSDKPKIVRGGSFQSTIDACRSACRDKEIGSTRRSDIGFRVVLEYRGGR